MRPFGIEEFNTQYNKHLWSSRTLSVYLISSIYDSMLFSKHLVR
jgi:hypothetical protein